ncbi:DUF6119 family protein [Paenibacillus plantarum]|uniref:DUF6119 family protein n=1 Tax=Paenibacillus plantarum TaxID=2654975 RepID=UPI001FECC42A|nr:DUF6119 family protein [Paenibacillus plantarum]
MKPAHTRPGDILEIVHELHYISLHEEKSGKLPRMYFIKNNEDNQPVLADLNKELLVSVKANDSKVSLAYFIEDDGDILIEPTKDDEVEIVYSKSYTLENYTIESIANKLIEIECEDISKVSIRPKSHKDKQVNLVRVLDFSTYYRSKNYCLFKGKWAIFNKSYIEFIKREILKVNEVAIYNEEYHLNNLVLEEGRKIQASDKDAYDQVTYAEYPFNIFLHNKFNYFLLDRKKGQQYYKSVEFADLFEEEEKMLIHVKIGDTADLRYCIQQSIHSAEIFNTQSDALEVHGIDKVRIISMLFVLSSPSVICEDGSINFLNNKSIYFQIEIIEWLIKVRTLGYIPQIITAKDLRT